MRARISLNILFDMSKKEVCKQNQKQNGSCTDPSDSAHSSYLPGCCLLLAFDSVDKND